MKKVYIGIILISFFIILILGMVVLVNRTNSNSNYEEANVLNTLQMSNDLDSISTNSSITKLSPDCKITFIKKYLSCNHSIREIQNISPNLVNLSLEEFTGLYSDWSVDEFSEKEVILSKEIPSYCSEHFIVKENTGYICVYSISSNGDFSLLKNTEIPTKYLPDGDIKELQKGVKIYGKDNLNSYLENFE